MALGSVAILFSWTLIGFPQRDGLRLAAGDRGALRKRHRHRLPRRRLPAGRAQSHRARRVLRLSLRLRRRSGRSQIRAGSRVAHSRSPVHTFDAHSTPLGLTFLRGTGWPDDFRGAAIQALHGSWNRTRKVGDRVVSLHGRPNGEIEERDFITGFELDEDVIGRPAGVTEGPDGAIYISDDMAGAIYRVAPASSHRASRTGSPAENLSRAD